MAFLIGRCERPRLSSGQLRYPVEELNGTCKQTMPTAGSAGSTRQTPAEKCGETSLNTFEQRHPEEFGGGWDAYQAVQRGTISKAFNLGLLPGQRKAVTVDHYNQGCASPWGCVDNGNRRCLGSEGQSTGFGPFMQRRYDALQSDFDPQEKQAPPPDYVQGWKARGVNSMSGWERGADGRYAWEVPLRVQPTCESSR